MAHSRIKAGLLMALWSDMANIYTKYIQNLTGIYPNGISPVGSFLVELRF